MYRYCVKKLDTYLEGTYHIHHTHSCHDHLYLSRKQLIVRLSMAKELFIVRTPRKSLEDLPTELLWLIADYSWYASISSLGLCNRRLFFSLNSYLYRQDMRHGGFQALRWAASEGRTATAQRVIDYRANVPLPHTWLQIALHRAIKSCSWGVIRLLVVHGADANTFAKGFGCVLQAASWKGDADLVQSLLDAGANINAQTGHYGTALAAAAWYGHISVVSLLLRHGADVNVHGGHYGNALQAASWSGHQDIVQRLIDNGALVHSVGGFYGSPLQAACWVGNEEIVTTLLRASRDTAFKDYNVSSALRLAYNRGHMSIFRALLMWTVANVLGVDRTSHWKA